MNLNFKFDEEDFFKAISITEEDEKVFLQFKRMYYLELSEKFQNKKIEGKLNDFQLKKLALKLSAHSKMLQTALEWFKGHQREDQLVILTLGDIFFRLKLKERERK